MKTKWLIEINGTLATLWRTFVWFCDLRENLSLQPVSDAIWFTWKGICSYPNKRKWSCKHQKEILSIFRTSRSRLMSQYVSLDYVGELLTLLLHKSLIFRENWYARSMLVEYLSFQSLLYTGINVGVSFFVFEKDKIFFNDLID